MIERIVWFLMILMFNLADSLFVLRYQKHLYGAYKCKKEKFIFRSAFIITLATAVISVIPVMILWGMVLFSSFWLGAYPGEKKNKLLFQMVLFLFAVLSVVLSFVTASICFRNETQTGVFTLLFSHVLFAVMAEAAGRFDRSAAVELPGKMWLVLVSIPAASLICVPAFSRIVGLNESIAAEIGKNQVIILIAVFFINVMVFYLFGKFSELLHTRMDTAVLEKQIQMQEKYYRAMEENHEKVRILRHDMRNQINTIAAMVEDREMEELALYLGQIKGSFAHVEKLIVTGNPPIDTILNIKISEMKDCGIQVKTNILLPKEIRLPFREAAILFGNLLDNVMEECSRLPQEKRWVTIQLSYTDQILFLKITNPMCAVQKEIPPKSEKKDTKAHGVGLKSVRQIVEQFHGTMKMTAQNSIFQITVILYGV